MASKLIVSQQYYDNLISDYNKLFSKCDKMKDLKKKAELFIELDLLNDRIEKAHSMLPKK